MHDIPEDRLPDIPDGRQPRWPVLVGLAIPLLLVLLSGLAVPADAGRFLGISLSSWCLFACAPLVSLCLLICWRFGSSGDSTQ